MRNFTNEEKEKYSKMMTALAPFIKKDNTRDHGPAYGWVTDDNGSLWGLVAGDMGYDNTNVKLLEMIYLCMGVEGRRRTLDGKYLPADNKFHETFHNFIHAMYNLLKEYEKEFQ